MPSRCQSVVSHNNLHRNEAKKSFYLSEELIKTIIPAFPIKISKIKSQVTKNSNLQPFAAPIVKL